MNSMHIYAALILLAGLWAGNNASPLFACDNDGINKFVADDRSLCTFHQCAFGKPVQFSCAKGSRVPSYFTKGPSDPCIVKVKKNAIAVCDRCNVTDDQIPGANKSNQCAQFRPCDARPGCTCVDQVAGYYCNCPPSATASPTPAHIEVQQCDVNICNNSGTCYTLYKNKFCNCKPPFTGKYCETNACNAMTCNQGECVWDSFGVYCACDRCYTGPCCEDVIVNCTNFCPNCMGGPNCNVPKSNLCRCSPCPANYTCENGKEGKPRQCFIPPDTAGSEFTLMFEENLAIPTNVIEGRILEIYVSAASSDEERTVSIEAPLIGYSASAVIEADHVYRFQVWSNLTHRGVGIGNFGIRVRETKNRLVNVYCMNRAEFSADGWLALPDKVAGRYFKVITYSPVTLAGQFAIVAIKDNTIVTINLVDSINGISNSGRGKAIEVRLKAFQTFQAQNNINTSDFTGSSIVSNNPIHVYSGEARGWVGPNETYKYYQTAINKEKSRDILVLECTSMETWGRTYALVPLPRTMIKYDETEEVIRIVGWTATSCTIYATKDPLIHSEINITLNNANDYFKQFYVDAAYNYFLSCDHSVMLVEITESAIFEESVIVNGVSKSKQYNDPSFIFVPAVSSYSNFYQFIPPKFSASGPEELPYRFTYVRLIATASYYKGIVINDEYIFDLNPETVKNWTSIYVPNAASSIDFPDLYGSIFRISSDNSTFISHPDKNAKFAAIVEGFDDRESYGIVLGASIRAQNIFTEAVLPSFPVVARFP